MNAVYLGALNGGIANELNTQANIERILGGADGYERLNSYLEDHNMSLYARTSFMSTSSYHKLFDQYRYTASRIRGSHAKLFNYHRPTRLPYDETQYQHRGDDYVINPAFYDAIFNRFQADFDYDNIMISDLGGLLAGHYDRSETIYLQDAIRYQQAVLEQSNLNTMLTAPFGFAMPYADQIIDLPTRATLYPIIDYEIPLLQLILSGLVDYSGESINLPGDRSERYQFLKHIETGSNLKYTLSYDDSRDLINTDYNYYMSTQYENWLDIIEAQVHEIDTLGIHQGHLIEHEYLGGNVYRVLYSHGVELLINYNLTAVEVDGITIDSLDYVVREGQ